MIQVQGQSLTEYLLLGVLVAVIAIGGLSAFNQELEASLPDLLDRIFNGGGNGVASSAMGNSISINSGSGAQSTAIEGLGPVELTLSSGETITLTQYPTDIPSVIETAGANGTTEILLANLEQVIQEFLQAEEITPEEARTLMNLANAGHEIASAQKTLEEALLNNPSALDPTLRTIGTDGFYEALTVNVNGEETLINSLYNDLGLAYRRPSNYSEHQLTNDFLSLASEAKSTNVGDDFGFVINPDSESKIRVNFNSVMNDFIQEYTIANENGSLDSPLIKSIIDDLSSEIIQVNSDFSTTIRLSNVYSNDPQGTYSTETPELLLNNLVSRTTDRDSGGICVTGGDTDSGIQCQ